MNEEKDPKREGHEQDFSEFAKHAGQRPEDEGHHRSSSSVSFGAMFLRGCAIVAGVVVLLFFLILGTCFLRA